MDHGHPPEFVASLDASSVATLVPATYASEAAPGAQKDFRILSVEGGQALLIGKASAGLSADWVDATRQHLAAAVSGELGLVKFIIFDLRAGQDLGVSRAPDANLLLGEIANLVLRAPIITIARARNRVGGGDLELALACCMLICDENAQFSFAADPIQSVATYALLAQKLGFVRAERLMDREEPLSAAEMRDLLLLKEVSPSGADPAELEKFLLRAGRRHNSAAAMYRAQRIATPLIPEFFGEMPH